MKITINFDEQLISNLIVALDHGHDGLSIRMVQVCLDSICKPLSIVFWNCLKAGYFLAAWKVANVPVYKNGNRQIPNSYGPVSLVVSLIEFFMLTAICMYILDSLIVTWRQASTEKTPIMILEKISL